MFSSVFEDALLREWNPKVMEDTLPLDSVEQGLEEGREDGEQGRGEGQVKEVGNNVTQTHKRYGT